MVYFAIQLYFNSKTQKDEFKLILYHDLPEFDLGLSKPIYNLKLLKIWQIMSEYDSADNHLDIYLTMTQITSLT